MQKNIWLIVGMAILLLIGVFYVLSNNQKQVVDEKASQLNLDTHKFEKILAYENDFMGNSSNTGNLFNNLLLSNFKNSFEMDSEKFILIVNYDTPSSATVEKAVIYNTTAAFVLIKNLEEIDLRFTDQSFVVKRDNVEKVFGNDFSELINPDVFKQLVQQPLLENESDDWLNQYTN